LYDIAIQTDSMFKRTVSAPGYNAKELYNLTLNDITLADLSLPLAGQQAPGDSYAIIVANKDDKPISISGVKARYYADELVFEARAGETYWLEFGADAQKTAPIYDISSYKNEILKGELNRAGLGEIVYIAEELPPARNYKPIFNIVVIVVALVLGAVILFRLKQK
jgi:hypothetical protein